MMAVEPGHREPETLGDRIAWRLIRICRRSMDMATGMSEAQKTEAKSPTTAVVADKPLTEAQWVCVHLDQFKTSSPCPSTLSVRGGDGC